MASNGLDGKIPIEEYKLKDALANTELSWYVGYKIKDICKTHHSTVYVVDFDLEDHGIKTVAVKHFHQPREKPGYDLTYTQSKDPHKTWARQTEVEKGLTELGKKLDEELIPIYCADSTKFLFSEHLPGPSLHELLIEAHNRINSGDAHAELYKETALRNAVRNSGHFVGRCIANCDQLESILGEEKSNGVEKETAMSLFKNQIARLYYSQNEDRFTGEEFELDDVLHYLNNLTLGIDGDLNFNKIVRKIFDTRDCLVGKKVPQQGDNNPLHHYYPEGTTLENLDIGTSRKVIDNEKFGYDSITRDLATIFVGGVDGISTPKGEDLHSLINQYIGHISVAAKTIDEQERQEHTKKIDELDHNDLFKYLIEEKMITRNNYAKTFLSFFSDAILESVHLHATYQRYDDNNLRQLFNGLNNYSVEEGKSCKARYAEELMNSVSGFPWLMKEKFWGDNAQEVKDHFYLMGNLLNELNILNLDKNMLNTIQNGGLQGIMYDHMHPTETRPPMVASGEEY
jgi:hypothetical protein